MHTIIPAPQRTRAQRLGEYLVLAALLFACAALAWRNPANRFILALLALVVIVAILRLFFDRCAVPLCIGVDRDTIRITRHHYWRLRPQTRDYPLRLFSGVGSYVRADAFGNAALFTVLLPQLPGQPSLRLGHHLLSLREEPSDLTAAAALRAAIAQYSGLPDRGLIAQPANAPAQDKLPGQVAYAPQYHGKERLRRRVPFILLVCLVPPCALLAARRKNAGPHPHPLWPRRPRFAVAGTGADPAVGAAPAGGQPARPLSGGRQALSRRRPNATVSGVPMRPPRGGRNRRCSPLRARLRARRGRCA